MDKISLGGFRCFGEVQRARLAPLTLLVGENSTGKTSFMALARALWEMAHQNRVPDFKEAPYDLGSFEEIVHHRGAIGGRAREFYAGFRVVPERGGRNGRRARGKDNRLHYAVTFRKVGTGPFPVKVKVFRGSTWVEWRFEGEELRYGFGTERGAWEIEEVPWFHRSVKERPRIMLPFAMVFSWVGFSLSESRVKLKGITGAKKPTKEDDELVSRLCDDARMSFSEGSSAYASAPVRSVPRRTYDPAPATSDPEGRYVPMYLANLLLENRDEWEKLKVRLERFGADAGLFDELSIRSLGTREGEPFQLQVRKFGGTVKGPKRNLIDVGYGVSQALGIVTELLRSDCPPMVLMQQPEIHLHPSAQAALGSLLCEVAHSRHQLIVETHSDHMLDRVRMDVRDGVTSLRPEEVSILFFERNGLEVRIHSLGIDKKGNILNAPESYRRFFLEETRRSVGV